MLNTIIIPLIMASLLGTVIGLERELTNKYAGLRTNLLVCLGSCVFTILSIYGFPTAIETVNPQGFGDPARIAAQVLTGIGFIGGGTVLKHGATVYGLTTAATLWISAAIGMACGAGMIELAVITTLLSFLVLVSIRSIESKFFRQNKHFDNYEIKIICQKENYENIDEFIMSSVPNLLKFSKKQNKYDDNLFNLNIVVRSNDLIELQKLFKEVEKYNINSLSIQLEDV
ncbi:MgtC/SapB family protein [bacterium]|nr:MgtC/SapB family protein [bacterium]